MELPSRRSPACSCAWHRSVVLGLQTVDGMRYVEMCLKGGCGSCPARVAQPAAAPGAVAAAAPQQRPCPLRHLAQCVSGLRYQHGVGVAFAMWLCVFGLAIQHERPAHRLRFVRAYAGNLGARLLYFRSLTLVLVVCTCGLRMLASSIACAGPRVFCTNFQRAYMNAM
eukprot:scaffold130120_cov23-Tisochrysis_lutea.AAC.1